MTEIGQIISQLEQQRTAIDNAIDALRSVFVGGTAAAKRRGRKAVKTTAAAAAVRKRHISPEGRRRIAAAMRKRWAEKKAAEASGKAKGTKATAKKAGSRA